MSRLYFEAALVCLFEVIMVMMWSRWNKQIGFATLLTVMLCWTAAVLAAPSAAEIDALIKKGDLAGARSGIEQVIQERPNSAKAYYLYAQILHAQGQMAQAREALNKAQQLSPSMDFADPAYLARLKKDLNMSGTAGTLAPQSSGAPAPRIPQSPPAANTTPQPTTSGGSWGLFPLLLLGLIVFGVVSFMRSRSRRRQQWYGQQSNYGQPMDRYPGGGVGPTGPMYGPTPPSAGRSGLAGAAGGFLAGLAGGALADSLFNRGHAAATPPTDVAPTEPPLNLGPDEGTKPAASDFDTAGLSSDWGGSDSNVASGNSSDFDTPSDFDSGGDDWS